MQRHRVRESQDWMGSLSLSHECRTVVLPMGNWPAEKWWQQTSVHVCMLNRGRLFATPRTVARQAPRPWDSPGNNTGVPCYFLLQELFPTQGLNSSLLYLLHWQVSSLPLHHLRLSQRTPSEREFSTLAPWSPLRESTWAHSFRIKPGEMGTNYKRICGHQWGSSPIICPLLKF